MDVLQIPITTSTGETATLSELSDGPILVVNIADRCGLTPQYETLEGLQRTYADKGFLVVGFPCSQFAGLRSGTDERILEYCSTTYGVTFPIMQQVTVNGKSKHPLYAELTKIPDQKGRAGRVRWNFEKFLVEPSGKVTRFRPVTKPDDPIVISAIEQALSTAA